MFGQSKYRISRKQHIELLSSKKNILLIGSYSTGKTLLAKEFLEKNKDAVYIDFSKISINPENFAAEFVCKVAKKSFESLLKEKNL